MNPDLIKDIIQWDVGSWSPALKFWEARVDWNKVHSVLELGGREGGLSLWAALKDKHVVCSDLKGVSATASPLHQKYKMFDKIRYEDMDACNIPYENHFDVIVFKSIIGGIGRNNDFEKQKKVFGQIRKALQPGGKLLFAENLIASPVHRIMRKKFVKWAADWRYLTVAEINECLKDFSSFELHCSGVSAAFGRTEFQRKLLAAFDRNILDRISPESWKYIVFGVAEK